MSIIHDFGLSELHVTEVNSGYINEKEGGKEQSLDFKKLRHSYAF